MEKRGSKRLVFPHRSLTIAVNRDRIPKGEEILDGENFLGFGSVSLEQMRMAFGSE